MKWKRIGAWALLALFVFLLLNIFIFHLYFKESIAVYVILLVFYLILARPGSRRDGGDAGKGAGSGPDAAPGNTPDAGKGA